MILTICIIRVFINFIQDGIIEIMILKLKTFGDFKWYTASYHLSDNQMSYLCP
jgi:hypothetical protein